jgi:hypothetical protein
MVPKLIFNIYDVDLINKLSSFKGVPEIIILIIISKYNILIKKKVNIKIKIRQFNFKLN